MRAFCLTILVSSLGWATLATAQVAPAPAAPADTTHKFENPTGAAVAAAKPWYRSKLVRATAIPAVLVGYGISTIQGHGFYSSYQARDDIRRQFPHFHTTADNYLQFVPYLELGAVALAGINSRDDRVNMLLVIGKSELIMLTSVYALKVATNIERPNGAKYAFPSGHTAQAFLAASIVHTEFRDKSQWYGIGAYSVAASVAALRMLNNRHWESDVFAGAGIGILSAHLAYLSHRNRWGRKPIGRDMSLSPLYYGGAAGLSFHWRPR